MLLLNDYEQIVVFFGGCAVLLCHGTVAMPRRSIHFAGAREKPRHAVGYHVNSDWRFLCFVRFWLFVCVCARVGYPLTFLFISLSQPSGKCLISFYWEQICVCVWRARHVCTKENRSRLRPRVCVNGTSTTNKTRQIVSVFFCLRWRTFRVVFKVNRQHIDFICFGCNPFFWFVCARLLFSLTQRRCRFHVVRATHANARRAHGKTK